MKLLVNYSFGLCIALAIASPGLAESRVVSPEQVPPEVWKTLQAASVGARPDKIERNDEDGTVTYDATFKSRSGGEQSVSVAQDGKLLSLEVTLADVPAPVRKTIAEQVGGGRVDEIDKETDADGTNYEVGFTTQAGGDRTLTIANDGTLLSREVSLEETPEGVQKAIKAHLAGGTLDTIEQAFDEGETTFDVDYTSKQGRAASFSLAPDGKLISMEVTLDEAPAEVQLTVNARIGQGKVLRVTKILGARQRVTRYEVEAAVDGKSFDFRVGPKGKFLGTDDQ